jgi:hypothetical protein
LAHPLLNRANSGLDAANCAWCRFADANLRQRDVVRRAAGAADAPASDRTCFQCTQDDGEDNPLGRSRFRGETRKLVDGRGREAKKRPVALLRGSP